jgi:signal transduction histidine kinase
MDATGQKAKDKDRIFEPFLTIKLTGTGIGLTVSLVDY